MKMRKKKTLVLELAEDSYDRSRNSSSTTKSLPWPFRGKTKKDHENKGVPYFSLFGYASTSDKALVILGIISNVLGALGLPLIIMFYGEFVTLLVDRKMGEDTISPVYIISWFGGGRKHKNGDEADLAAAIKEDAVAFGIGCTVSAVIQLVFSFLSVLFLNFASLKQSSKIRRLFLKAVLRQDMSWFDVNNANNFASKVTEDLDKIQEGMGEKIGLFLFLVLTFLSSVIMALFKGWKLTLVMLVCSPFIIISNAIIGKVQTNLTADELKAYGKAGSVAQEVFSSIKTVMSFGGEEKEIERYQKELESSRKSGIRRGRLSGYGGGFMWFIFYACHSLAFWYGVKLILESREAKDFEYTPSVIIMVFFGVIAGAMNMGYAAPHLEAFAAAKGAASSIFSVIKRVPAIDSLSPNGKILSDVKGEIQFRNIAFQYPARPETTVLQGFNINIKEGQVVALVGSSGSGKSTVVQLLQRFYDPSEGSVLLDGEDLKNLNVSWLRRQIGVVGQEPSLFGTTIYENIKYGLENATRQDVENAAKLANAHDFIMKLPKNYETVLGEKGTQISGGQKQRIAIARALIRNPKILLLDEATSALDAANERVVQLALNRATKGRTTLVVSHKISNITTADKIIVLSEGRIVEEGTHEELIALKNHYFRLLHMESTAQPDVPHSITTNVKDVDVPHSITTNVKDVDLHQSQRPSPVITGRYSVASLNGSIALMSQEPEDIVDDEDIRPAPVSRIFKLSKPEWLYLLLGSISTLLVGASLPVVAVLFGELYGVLSDPDPEYMMSATSYYCGLFLAIGVVVGIGTFFQSYAFNKAGVELTTRMRIATFSAILKQEAGWFDDEKNRTGVLCARLSGDASSMQGAAGSRISVVLQSISTLLIGAVLSLFYSWKMTLVTLITVPVVFFGIFLESRVIQGQSLLEKKSIEKATKVAIEAITNIRTVASLGKEQSLLDLYDKELLSGERTMHIKSVMRGFAFALGQTAPFVCYGISLWYGGVLVADEGLHYKNVIKVSEALLYGAWVLGQSLAFAPNFLAAKLSAARIFKILDRTPKISNGIMRQDPNWQTDGQVSLNQVKFAYPTRPEVEVLKGLDLDIQKGLSIALAGQSGCGKSTIIQLLQKLYDPLEGKIYLDNLNLSDMEISKLRKQFGLVSQEPVLFDRTIAENIAYGDNTRKVPHCDIIAAAKSANIHDFISCLPLGYETRLGAGGAQLSGGQKQRIAIARALVRNPKILLLDEATSALDPASESVVQAALDSAVEGRTTITIGHRPGAVLRADVIYFLDQGRITEKGTHEELLRAKGKYADMHFHDKS